MHTGFEWIGLVTPHAASQPGPSDNGTNLQGIALLVALAFWLAMIIGFIHLYIPTPGLAHYAIGFIIWLIGGAFLAVKAFAD